MTTFLYFCLSPVQADSLQTEVDQLKDRVEELTLDLELLRSEIEQEGLWMSFVFIPPGNLDMVEYFHNGRFSSVMR